MLVVIKTDDDMFELRGDQTLPIGQLMLQADNENPLDGWYSTPGAKNETIGNPFADGSFTPSALYQNERTLTVKGLCFPLSSVEEGQLIDRLNNLVCKPLTIMVHDSSGMRFVHGFVSDSTSITVRSRSDMFTFSVIVTCPDPLKYGPEQSYTSDSDEVTVDNPGVIPVYPKFLVSGSPSSFTVSNEYGSVSWSGSGASQVSLDLSDMIPSSGSVGVASPFKIPVGVSMIHVSTVPASCQVSVSFNPAWR